MSFLGKLSFQKALTLIALVPLFAVLGLGGTAGYNSYQEYQKLTRAAALAKLAYHGGELMMIMPLETAPNRMEIRKKSDAIYSEMMEQMTVVEQLGYSDPITAQLKTNLQNMFARMPEYRAKLDAGDPDPILPLRYAQPVASAGLDLTLRSANLTEDLTLSSEIRAHHALMKVNEAYLALNRMGQFYISNGAFGKAEFVRFSAIMSQSRNFNGPFRELAKPEIIQRYDSFFDTADGKLVSDTIKAMESLEDYAGPRDPQPFTDSMSKRRDFVSTIIRDNADALMAATNDRLAGARSHMLLVVGGIALFSLMVVCFSILMNRTLSRSIRKVSASMIDLANGDTAKSIPFTDRSDEIGDMARSVEVFREAAIRNQELEAAADENRRRAELERVEVQRRAEAEAEERLNKATGSLADGLCRLASGDLICEISEEFAPQFEALRHDFNTSVQQLRAVLISVGASAGAVSGGSGEISNASDNLAKRTEQQAASLEETAAALEQITANVKATSQRTAEARDIVRTTTSRAEASGVVVGNAVTAMERIEHSSKQISQIIGVIDEIAFQTNLLALNAGVEAARAGEAGRGFAVVAQEVRELAQRSANAAKEIKNLIGNSEVAVSEGVKLVNDTGEGLKDIAGLVLTINEHMNAIASAAQEQSVGLGEVNTAVNHMDQATQQNAAMVEEMNAASAGLAQEASDLAQLLRQFQTGNGNMAASSRAAHRAAPAAGRSNPQPSARGRPVPAVSGNTALAANDWEEF